MSETATETAVAHEGRLTRLETNLDTLLGLVRDIKKGLEEHPARLATLEAEQISSKAETGRAFVEIAAVRGELNNLGASVNGRFADAAAISTKIDSRVSKWVYLGTGAFGALSVMFALAKLAATFFGHGG